jgi:glycosyl transferase family 25
MFDDIEKVVYINLDERVDRKLHVQRELLKVFPVTKLHRLPAIKNTTNGGIGCSMSHIAVLEKAKQEGWRNVLIVEDDFTWANLEEGGPVLSKLLFNPYDVIVLTGTYVKYTPETYKLRSCQTTTAYIVHSSYYDTLIANYKDGVRLLQETGQYTQYALDQYWKLLQAKDNWYVVYPVMGFQIPGFSDIESKFVDYRRFYTTIR